MSQKLALLFGNLQFEGVPASVALTWRRCWRARQGAQKTQPSGGFDEATPGARRAESQDAPRDRALPRQARPG